MTRILRLALTGAALTASMALAGCAGGTTAASSTGHGGTTGTAGTSVQQQARTVWLQYARCVRSHGYPSFPDPVVAADGSASLGDSPQSKQDALAAQGACGAILSQLPASVTRQPVTPANLRTERLLAGCLRRNGLPYWPDPLPDGSFPLSRTPYANIGKSPQVQSAFQACHQYDTGGIRAS